VAFLGTREDWEEPLGRATRAAAKTLGVALVHAEVTVGQYQDAFAGPMRERPAIHPFREMVEVGGRISFGANVPDLYRRAAGYVDRILKGARPGDLPVEQPTQFELIVNVKTAKLLGLTLPRSEVPAAAGRRAARVGGGGRGIRTPKGLAARRISSHSPARPDVRTRTKSPVSELLPPCLFSRPSSSRTDSRTAARIVSPLGLRKCLHSKAGSCSCPTSVRVSFALRAPPVSAPPGFSCVPRDRLALFAAEPRRPHLPALGAIRAERLRMPLHGPAELLAEGSAHRRLGGHRLTLHRCLGVGKREVVARCRDAGDRTGNHPGSGSSGRAYPGRHYDARPPRGPVGSPPASPPGRMSLAETGRRGKRAGRRSAAATSWRAWSPPGWVGHFLLACHSQPAVFILATGGRACSITLPTTSWNPRR
jgi:hypothetical protein